MAASADLTTRILIEIRDNGVQTNARLDQLRDDLGARLDQTNARLDTVIHEQIRHATAIVALEQGQRDLTAGMQTLVEGQHALVEGMRTLVDEVRKVNARLDHVLTGPLGNAVRDHSAQIDAHETRIAALEARQAPRTRRRRSTSGG